MRTTGIFCAILLCVFCKLRGNQTQKYGKMISKFISLHMNVCGYSPLCTAAQGINSTQFYSEKPCCRPCSCNSECHRTGTCCLDTWNLDSLGNATVKNISNIVQVLTEQRNAFNNSLYNHDNEDNNSTETCVTSGLLNAEISLGYRRKNEAFLIISKCSSSNHSNSFKGKCENPGLSNIRHFDENIPVTSCESLKTYRNKYCLMCNEGNVTDYKIWKSMLTCVHDKVVQNFIDRPEVMFRKISSSSYNRCNIIFQPPSVISPHVKKCDIYDVSSCNKNETSRRTEAKLSDVYYEMCKLYSLPVYTAHKNTLKKFKNVACFMCSERESLNNLCGAIHDQPSEYNLEINILDEELTDGYLENTVLALQNVSMPDIDVAHCGEGFVHDSVSNTCRKVLCPRHHYIYQRACVPMITRVYNVFYRVVLEARPTITLSRNATLIEAYETQLAFKVNETVLTELLTINFELWRQKYRRGTLNHYIALSVVGRNETYANIVQKITDLLKRISYLEIHLNARGIVVEIDITRKSFKRSVDKIAETDTSEEIDVVRKQQTPMTDIREFEISRSHLCHRIALNRSEVLILGKSKMKVINTGKHVSGQAFEADRKLGFFACIEDALMKGIFKEVKDNTRVPEADLIPTEKLMIIGGVVSVVTLLTIILVRKIMNYRKRHTTQNNTANDRQ